MVKYKLIIEYYQKGNNNSQIATLCGCSRTVVWEVLNRFNKIETIFADIQRMSEEELRILLFPERVKKDKGYLIPDFKWEEFQMRKHQSSLRLCWRRYCKRAAKQNLKAYSWASFGLFYIQYRKPCSDEDDPNDKVRNKLKHYNLLMSFCDPGRRDRFDNQAKIRQNIGGAGGLSNGRQYNGDEDDYKRKIGFIAHA